ITVQGINTHPSEGKGVMVNAVRILSQFLARLPTDHLSPETTEGREGFMHPDVIDGGVATASARIILRDFETARLSEQADLLRSIAADLQQQHPRARIEVAIRKQYRNMRDGLEREPRALEKAIEATRAAGLEPRLDIIRGGTDGAQMADPYRPQPR